MLGYFTEIEILQKKIKDLEDKLEQERVEHRDAYQRMKQQAIMSDEEIQKLKKENSRLQMMLLETIYEDTEKDKK
jgi:hypothetical protein